MSVLQIGAHRSGNSWLHGVIDALLDLAGAGRRSYIRSHPVQSAARGWALRPGEAGIDMLAIEPEGCACVLGTRFREPVPDVAAYARQTRHVWTHSSWCRHSAGALAAFSHRVYIVRDPRDAAVSFSHYAYTAHGRERLRAPPPAERARLLERGAPSFARRWAAHVGPYLRHRESSRIHFVFYERLLHDFAHEVRALADHLGLAPDAPDIERVAARTDFRAMHARAPEHVRRGGDGYWRDEFTDAMMGAVRAEAGELMSELGYPLDHPRPRAARRLPSLPAGARGPGPDS